MSFNICIHKDKTIPCFSKRLHLSSKTISKVHLFKLSISLILNTITIQFIVVCTLKATLNFSISLAYLQFFLVFVIYITIINSCILIYGRKMFKIIIIDVYFWKFKYQYKLLYLFSFTSKVSLFLEL